VHAVARSDERSQQREHLARGSGRRHDDDGHPDNAGFATGGEPLL
jgi:hypothetical protein